MAGWRVFCAGMLPGPYPGMIIMCNGLFPFDRVLVMDRYPLSGLGLCALADGVAGRCCSEYVSTLTALYQAYQRYPEERLLLITELISDTEPLRQGLALLQALGPRIRSGQCRVVVCTDLHDPLLLKAIVNIMPSVVVLRSEPLSVLRDAIRLAASSWPGMRLSPVVTDGLALTRDYNLTPREMEWLVTQADGLDLRTSARVMNVSYKTVSAWRRNIARRTGSQGKGAFNLRLAWIRRSVTGGLLITARAVNKGEDTGAD